MYMRVTQMWFKPGEGYVPDVAIGADVGAVRWPREGDKFGAVVFVHGQSQEIPVMERADDIFAALQEYQRNLDIMIGASRRGAEPRGGLTPEALAWTPKGPPPP